MHIPSTGERVELLLGWKIVDITPDERALLHAHGVDIASLLTGRGDIDLL